MQLLEDKNQHELPHETCHCDVCLYRPKIIHKPQLSDVKTPNQLHKLIKLLSPSIPILIEHTLLIEHKQTQTIEYHSYSNSVRDQKRKWSINHQMVRSINSLITQNVTLYYKYREKNMPRFEASQLLSNRSSILHNEEVLYIQPYQPRPVVRIHFINQKRHLKEDLLIEHLRKQQDRFKLIGYKPNESFFEWVYTEYGQTTFCNFITELYVRLFKISTNHIIINAIFFWILQPIKNDIQNSKSRARTQYEQMHIMGRPKKLTFKPKLINIRHLQIQFYQKLYSFQQQYSQLIKKRIYSSNKTHISAIKNKAYRSRLENFREKLQNVYHQQQEAVLSKVEPQKAFEFEQDSQKMVRLLVPNLPKDQTLRQVLSDQKALRILIGKQKNRRLMTQSLGEDQNRSGSLHLQRPKKMIRNITVQNEIPNLQSVHKRYQKLLKTPSTQDKLE